MLIQLIGLLLVIALLWYLITYLPLPQPVRMVVIVIGCVILLIWVINAFGLGGGLGSMHLN